MPNEVGRFCGTDGSGCDTAASSGRCEGECVVLGAGRLSGGGGQSRSGQMTVHMGVFLAMTGLRPRCAAWLKGPSTPHAAGRYSHGGNGVSSADSLARSGPGRGSLRIHGLAALSPREGREARSTWCASSSRRLAWRVGSGRRSVRAHGRVTPRENRGRLGSGSRGLRQHIGASSPPARHGPSGPRGR